jgi:hypothetical protein
MEPGLAQARLVGDRAWPDGRCVVPLMIYKLGRLLQLLGLVVLPVAIAGEIGGHIKLWPSLSLSAAGVTVFVIGWLLQQAARPR